MPPAPASTRGGPLRTRHDSACIPAAPFPVISRHWQSHLSKALTCCVVACARGCRYAGQLVGQGHGEFGQVLKVFMVSACPLPLPPPQRPPRGAGNPGGHLRHGHASKWAAERFFQMLTPLVIVRAGHDCERLCYWRGTRVSRCVLSLPACWSPCGSVLRCAVARWTAPHASPSSSHWPIPTRVDATPDAPRASGPAARPASD